MTQTTSAPAGGAPGATPAGGDGDYRYDAFISYRHVEPDRGWAQWLHAALETYRVPARLVRERGVPPRVRRVFRDEDELPASSDLNNEIELALAQSRYLIVVCSPRTPASRWVNREVERFREMGRHNRILALLIEGDPAASFPRAMVEVRRRVEGAEDRIEEVEPLAADVRATRNEPVRHLKRMARLRVMAILLGVRFDDLRQREQERRARRLAQLGATLAGLLVLVGCLAVYAVVQRNDAVAQRRVAEAQRAAADEQRRAAEAERRRAELELAGSVVLQGDMLGTAGRWPEAGRRYADAERLFARAGESPLPARLGLWDASRHVPPPLDLLTGHAGGVWAVAASPDGRRAVSAGRDGTLRVWDLPTGRLDRTVDGAGELIGAVAFLPDGVRVLSSGKDGAVRLWDVEAGTLLRTFAAPAVAAGDGKAGRGQAVTVGPGGRWFVAGGADGVLRQWDVDGSTTEPRRAIPVGDGVHCVAVSADSREALCGTGDAHVVHVGLDTGQVLNRFAGHTIFASGVGFLPETGASPGKTGNSARRGTSTSAAGDEAIAEASMTTAPAAATAPTTATATPPTTAPATAAVPATRPATRRLAVSASYDKTLRVWDLTTGAAVQTLDTVTTQLCSLTVAPDGRVVTGCWDGSAKVWDLAAGRVVQTLAGHGATMVRATAVTPDGRVALSAAEDGVVAAWDLTGGAAVRTIDTAHLYGTPMSVAGVDFARDGRTAFVATAEGFLRTYEVSTGRMLRAGGRFGNLAFVARPSPDGTRALVGGLGALGVWDLDVPADGRGPALALDPHADIVGSVAFSADGRVGISGSQDKTARVWDLSTGRVVRQLALPGAVTAVDLTADGRTALAASLEGVRVWDAAGSAEPRVVGGGEPGPASAYGAARFSPDGRTILAGTQRGNVRLFDVATGGEVRPMDGAHTFYVGCVAFSPDGRLAASGADDGSVRVWDVTAGRELRLLAGHRGRVAALAFAPDGRALLTGGADGTARVWDFAHPDALRAAAARLAEARRQLDARPDDGAALLAAAEARAAQGHDAWAADCLRRAEGAGTAPPPVLLGRVLWNVGDLAGAKAAFARAVARDPGDAYARACLAAVDGSPHPPIR